MSEEDFKLEEYFNKCRCCFRNLEDEKGFVKISRLIQQRFFDLTEIQLVENEAYSSVICNFCDNDLEVFSKFRFSLVEKQNKLYRAGEKCGYLISYPELTTSPKITIKAEIEDELNNEDIFIDCPTFIGNNELKVENFDYYDDKKIHKKRKEIEVNNEEHQKLLEEFKIELKKNKDKNVQCPRCFKFLHRDSIKEHINVVHFKQNKFQCEHEDCGYSASRFGRVMMHMKAVHKYEIDSKYEQTKQPKKQCNVCGSLVRNWRRHVMKVHMNIKNFFCDSCPYGAFFKYDLEQHMRVHIQKQPKEPQKYFCEMCGLDFEKRFHLNAHVKAKHTKRERIHQCSICEKAFFSAENLKKHVESHGAKVMPCEFCGKLFSCMNNLRTHLYYHSEPKFICDFPNCDKKFYMRKRLRAHVKTHNGQKDFGCTFCEKSYFSQNDLNRHLFSIHQKMRFFCQVPGCHGNFSRREYYKKHAIAHHQSLGPEGLLILLQSIKEALPCQKF
ncbi:CLUMA_CG006469, isoform A [Clunio marinus]|uniref:CLUMA_CG006469, isoform A n=1 Tax=Clunio marinus TaxID=568069 RepID=A0A1J1HY44_9DIPT|nr:CLUMA_CG006469, isoform A [Clunio marinus]